MFDFENPFKVAADMAAAAEQVEELTACDPESVDVAPDWENAEWDKITAAHAAQANATALDTAQESPEDVKDRIYRKIDARHKERTGIASVRYALVAIGLSAIAYLIRNEVTWLAITLCAGALVFGLISAYGVGKYHEM